MKLFVKTKEKKYPIYFGANNYLKIKKILNENNINSKKTMVVYDKNVPKKIISKFRTKLINNENIFIGIKFNEKIKNLNTVKKILDSLGKNNFNRNDCVISVGGGIAGDICSFASSVYKRGLKFVNIPTTLLSQVDSSIGGKTGVNNFLGKNMIGTFYQPNAVINDIIFLKSLPRREMICGYAEILKHSLIYSVNNFNYLNKYYKEIFNLKNPYLLDAIYQSCNIKKKIVEKDENEKELRKILNLGHTFGHAYEATSGFGKKINHGEGVILGIRSAIKFSLYKSYIKNKNYKKILDHLNKLDFNLKLKNIFNKNNISSLIKFMTYDKKNTSDKINLILLKDIGKPILNRKFDIKELKKFFNKELMNL